MVNVFEALAEKNIAIVPTTMVGGGDGGSGLMGILTAYLAQKMEAKKK